MRLILKCQNELLKLSKLKSQVEKKNVLKNVNNCVIKAIAEISHNCLIGNVPLSSSSYKKLNKYKVILRKLANKKIVLDNKRKLIVQKGGILNILLPAVLSLISSVIEKKFLK